MPPVRVATFNILHGERADGAGVDVDLLVEACRSLDADLLGLQEVDRRVRRSGRADLAGAVAAATGMHLAFGRSLRTGGGEYGNALLARHELAEVSVLALPREGRQEPRSAVVGRVDGLAVAVTHLGLRQGESLRQLHAVIAALTEPCILMGDFNRHPEQVVPALADAGFVVAESGPTFPAVTPRSRIDYIAVRGLAVGDVAVVPTPVSDHCALVAEVTGERTVAGEWTA